jgi:hypothetical protein
VLGLVALCIYTTRTKAASIISWVFSIPYFYFLVLEIMVQGIIHFQRSNTKLLVRAASKAGYSRELYVTEPSVASRLLWREGGYLRLNQFVLRWNPSNKLRCNTPQILIKSWGGKATG